MSKGNRKKKKRKWKKQWLILFSFLLLFLFLFFLMKPSTKQKAVSLPPEETDYVEKIVTYQKELSPDFLNWVKEKYSNQVLKEILSSLEQGNYELSIWHKLTGNSYQVLQDFYQNVYQDNPRVKVIEGNKDEIQISFAGDVSLADNWKIMPYYNARKQGVEGIFSSDILAYMKQSDIMIVNNEFCFSETGTPMPKKAYTFRANPRNVSIYQEMGVDLVTLANNHVYDYGTQAFLDTLTTLEKANIPKIGAGKNLEEAKSPYYFIINGYKIAFINATRAEKFILTPEATDTTPGVFRAYDPNPLRQLIQDTKAHSDYVVVLLHWGTEDTHQLEEVQKETGKLYIDSGADLVVGSHAHVLQGVEFYQDHLIAYNVGDFLFNAQTKNTGILTWKLREDGTSEYSFLPAIQKDGKTSIIYGEEANQLYQKMTSWSINGQFLEDGTIRKN